MSCAKAVLEAKSNYRAAVQETKMVRSSQLQKLEVAFGKALSEQHSMENMQGSCRNWRNKLLGRRVKVVTTSFLLIKPFFIMLCSISGRIWLPSTMHC